MDRLGEYLRLCDFAKDSALEFVLRNWQEGGVPPSVNLQPNAMTTAEVVAACHELGEKYSILPIEESIVWLLDSQLADGSWSDPNSENPWDVSSTAWTLWALKESRSHRALRSQQSGLRWLTSKCDSSGGLSTNSNERSPNTYATSYAHRTFSCFGKKEPTTSTFRFLRSRQNLNGGWGLRVNDKSDPTLTCYVLHGLIDGHLDSAEPVIRAGFRYLDSIRSPIGTWKSWLEDSESVEGTAFGLYMRLKYRLPLTSDDFSGLEFIIRRIRHSDAWQIDGVDQIWVGISVLLAAHSFRTCLMGDDGIRRT